MSAAERGVQELSHHQGISAASGKSFVVSESASQTEALNNLDQQSSRTADTQSTSDTSARNRAVNLGAQVGAGVGLPGISPIKASISGQAGVNASWSHSNADQHSVSSAKESGHTTNYSQNVDTILRGVQEGSYRATNEEGQRLLDNISTSLERAHQEQQLASNQFQQAESYRQVASIAEENAVSINSNATQEFMGQLQHGGQSMRTTEQVMVNHPEQAQAMADQFVQAKTQEYMQGFQHQAGSTPGKISETYQENNQTLKAQQQQNNPVEFHHSNQGELSHKAHDAGFVENNLVDTAPIKQVKQMVAQESKKIEDNNSGGKV